MAEAVAAVEDFDATIEAAAADSHILSYIDEEEEEEDDATMSMRKESMKSAASGNENEPEPVYSRIRSKNAAREYLSLCSVRS